MKLFDSQSWLGRWPFSFLEAHENATSLRRHLRRYGIGRALVSHLEAVLQPEPGPANRRLLLDTRRCSDVVPVPIINPALANWEEELIRCTADRRVRAVRILPNYHGYRLTHPRVQPLVDSLQKKRLKLILQIRLIDERHEYHAMRLRRVTIAAVGDFLDVHPRWPVLVCGLMRSEFVSLAKGRRYLFADMSFLEWHRTIEDALTHAKASQLAFSSHTPFFATRAACDKLLQSSLPASVLARIGAGNLERWLNG